MKCLTVNIWKITPIRPGVIRANKVFIKEILVKVVNGCKSLTLSSKKAHHTEAVVHRYSSNMCF